MRRVITLLLAVFCSNSFSDDLPDLGGPAPSRYELSKGQIAAEAAFVAQMVIDYLSKLPANTLKIDRSFVTDMTAGP
jgi:hypothetical protein